MEINDVKYLIVHKSHTPDDEDIGVEELDRIHRLNGAIKIRHHYIIRKNGEEEKGRLVTERGIHTEEYNKESISLCLIGDKNFTTAQLTTLRKKLKHLRTIFHKAKIVGHQDLVGERDNCPGFDVRDWYGLKDDSEITIKG